MHKVLPISMPTLALLIPLAAAGAEDTEALVQKNCIGCHGSEVYTRPDRRIQSFSSLETQVRRCSVNLDLAWFEDEIEDVAQYLNRKYYHFEP